MCNGQQPGARHQDKATGTPRRSRIQDSINACWYVTGMSSSLPLQSQPGPVCAPPPGIGRYEKRPWGDNCASNLHPQGTSRPASMPFPRPFNPAPGSRKQQEIIERKCDVTNTHYSPGFPFSIFVTLVMPPDLSEPLCLHLQNTVRQHVTSWDQPWPI